MEIYFHGTICRVYCAQLSDSCAHYRPVSYSECVSREKPFPPFLPSTAELVPVNHSEKKKKWLWTRLNGKFLGSQLRKTDANVNLWSRAAVRTWAANTELLRVCSIQLTESSYAIWSISVISKKGEEREWVSLCCFSCFNRDQCFIFPRWEIILESHFNHRLNHASRKKNTIEENQLIYLFFAKQTFFFLLFFFFPRHRRWHRFVPDGRKRWESQEFLSGPTISFCFYLLDY